VNSVPLGKIAYPVSERAGSGNLFPVYSVTKHNGFVRSDQYFSKQVFSRELNNYKVVREGHFAYATIHLDEGSIGIAPEDSLVSPMYTSFATNAQLVDSSYLIRFLKSPRALARYPMLGKGSAERRRSISFQRLAEMPVPLPAIDHQRRIAAILDKADELRAKRRQALAHLDSLTQSIFHSMFERSQPSWPTRSIEELAAPQKGAIRTGPFGSQLLTSEFTPEGVAVLGIDNAVSNKFTWRERRYISPEKYEQLKRYTVRPGDLLVTIMGTLGRCAVVPSDIPPAINTKHLCCITLDQRQAVPQWLHAYFLQSKTARMYLAQTTKGAIMGGLNMGIVKKMPVKLPPLELQQTFTTRVAAVERLKETHREHLAQLDTLFASLQHRAFNGEL
jgi:type I restriction enzyme, S subunit